MTAQLRAIWPSVVAVLVISTGVIGTMVLLRHWTGFGYGRMTRDLASIAGFPPYAGFVSQLGLLLWAATSAICLIGAVTLYDRAAAREPRNFLATAGVLSFVLGMDDAFQLHEGAFPRAGIPEVITLGSYMIFMLFFLIRFRSHILNTDYLLLGFALVFFSFSMVFDNFQPAGMHRYVYEDSTRFIGIVGWLTYFFQSTRAALVDRSVGHPD